MISRSLVAAIAAVLTVAVTQIASAAPHPHDHSWTGFYVGGNLGYGWGKADTETSGNGINRFLSGAGPGAAGASFGSDHQEDLDGIVGGGEFGYNYQINRWVLGIAADIQAADQRGSDTSVDPIAGSICIGVAFPGICTGTLPFISGTAVTNLETKIKWFGTVRGRVGCRSLTKAARQASQGGTPSDIRTRSTRAVRSRAWSWGLRRTLYTRSTRTSV